MPLLAPFFPTLLVPEELISAFLTLFLLQQTLVLPKVESVDDVLFVLDKIKFHRTSHDHPFPPISLVLSVESANSLLQMSSIIERFRKATKGQDGAAPPAIVSALLFAR
jgi:hypothetical protein